MSEYFYSVRGDKEPKCVIEDTAVYHHDDTVKILVKALENVTNGRGSLNDRMLDARQALEQVTKT